MKHIGEVARRYASAFYELVREKEDPKKVLEDVRALKSAIEADAEIRNFFSSPLIKPSDKQKVMQTALEKLKIAGAVRDYILLLARRNRLKIFTDSMEEFQNLVDGANNVVRGTVESAEELTPQERTQIENIINKNTGKKVILNYSENSSLMGGTFAQVGSLTFDDTLSLHLRKLKEELKKRRVH